MEQTDTDFENQLLMQFYLSNQAPQLFATVYLCLAIGNVFLTPVGNIASLELANSEILLEETLMVMREEEKDCQQQHYDLWLLISTWIKLKKVNLIVIELFWSFYATVINVYIDS